MDRDPVAVDVLRAREAMNFHVDDVIVRQADRGKVRQRVAGAEIVDVVEGKADHRPRHDRERAAQYAAGRLQEIDSGFWT